MEFTCTPEPGSVVAEGERVVIEGTFYWFKSKTTDLLLVQQSAAGSEAYRILAERYPLNVAAKTATSFRLSFHVSSSDLNSNYTTDENGRAKTFFSFRYSNGGAHGRDATQSGGTTPGNGDFFYFISERTSPVISSTALTDDTDTTDGNASLKEHFGQYIAAYSWPRFTSIFAIDNRDPENAAAHHLVVRSGSSSGTVVYDATATTDASTASWSESLPALPAATYFWEYSIADAFDTTPATQSGSFVVAAYAPPVVSTFQVTRYKYVTGNNYTAAPDGGYIWVTLAASASAATGAANSASLGFGTDGTTFTTLATGSNGLTYSVDERDVRTPSNAIYRSAVSAGSDVPFYVRLTDKVTSVIATSWACADGAYFNVEKYGVAVGKRSEGTANDKLFEVADDYRSAFGGGVVIGGDSIVNADLRICGDIRVDGDTRLCGNVQVAGILDFYPIGSIYISTINSNPANYFGGTWQAFGQGRMLIGAGTGTDANSVSRSFSANDTGGEYDHTLTINEIPSHRHSMDTGGKTVNKGTNYNRPTNATAYSSSHTYQTTYQGGDAAHNNMPPYIAAYMWVRTA